MRIVIVEDEPVSRETLRLRLEREPDVAVVGEASSGREAVRMILELLPDAIFLDIDIPAPDGFGVLREVAATHLPAVVFVTAHDEYALAAFDVHAVDYLLKPIDQDRVQRAVARARRAAGSGADAAHERLAALLTSTTVGPAAPPASEPRRLVVRTGRSYRLIEITAIEWLESAGNYVRVHANGRAHLLRSTLRELESSLAAEKFVRIHRRAVVNVECVSEIIPTSHGDCKVVLKSGARLRMSRSYRGNLLS